VLVRTGQEQSDRCELVPADRESLTSEGRPGSVATLRVARDRLAGCSSWPLRFAVYWGSIMAASISSAGQYALPKRDKPYRRARWIAWSSCVRGASLEETLGKDSPIATSMGATATPRVQPEDHRNTLDRKVLQKTRVLAVAPAKTATRPAVAPKLRQNRFKYRATTVGCQRYHVLCTAGISWGTVHVGIASAGGAERGGSAAVMAQVRHRDF
jgi:hypothetical protein